MNNEYFKNLNEKQFEAVGYTEGPLLILAGAGSGKTTVLINRVLNILDSHLAYPSQVLAITFTNKAAAELKSRLEKILGSDANDVWALTFHSACVRILRQYADLLGYDKYFTIYDTSDSVSLIKKIIKDFNIDEKLCAPKVVLGTISKSKDQYMFPEDFEKVVKLNSDLIGKKIAEIYYEYQKRLISSNAMDFDDLIFNTVRLLKDYPYVREYWQNKFKYILIDEYQDTNKLQYKLISYLVNPNTNNICVVGDDSQSIYRFRGATIENILTFEQHFDNCKVIKLEQNYRSTGHILSAANNVIKNNEQKLDKKLWTASEDGNKITLYVADNERDEANYVSSTILSGISSGASYSDYAVLYRMNAQSNNFEYAFKRHGIPYKIVGGIKFFDRAEVKDVLSYLNVISSLNDDLRLERIINNPPRGIGAKSIEAALNIAHKEGKSLFEIIKHSDLYEELARPSYKMREFAKIIEDLKSFSENNTSDILFDEVLDKTGYLKMYEEKDDLESISKAENIKEIKTSILGYISESGDCSLEGYLANVALYTDLDSLDGEQSYVTLMTLHSSKGLEYPTVFISGMEDSIFPGLMALGDEDELQEERRLCYVGITRAMRNLYLTCAKMRMIYGRTQSNRVSRFVNEIPNDDIFKVIPKGYGYYDNSSVSEYRNTVKENQKSAIKPNFSSPPAKQIDCTFFVGDNIKHSAFGEGVIVNSTPVGKGSDYLLEINFNSVGTKRLMYKTAARFISKI